MGSCGRSVVARGGLGPHAAKLVAFASFTAVIIRNVFLIAACCRSKRDEVSRSRGIVLGITCYFKMTFWFLKDVASCDAWLPGDFGKKRQLMLHRVIIRESLSMHLFGRCRGHSQVTHHAFLNLQRVQLLATLRPRACKCNAIVWFWRCTSLFCHRV